MQIGQWGERLRAFRARMQMKQEAAAAELGVSQAYISRIEAGGMEPSSDIVARLETLLRAPEHRDHFDHWRAAIRHCPGYASLLRQHDGHICVVEVSRGMRELGRPFADLVPGDTLINVLGTDVEPQLDAFTATGVLEGKVSRVEEVWRIGAGEEARYFDSVSTPVRDDLGNWHVHTCHRPVERGEYEMLREDTRPRIVQHID